MLKVGLTGNIGSGKTLIASILQKMGAPVFQADLEAGELYHSNHVKEKILSLFGDQVFYEDGEINKKAIADIVFRDDSKLKRLNDIIHPLVRDKYRDWIARQAGHPYTLYEAAILFESGHYREMDKVICVTAPEELRMKRVMERDQVSEEEVRQRMANQWKEERKIQLADFIIVNDGKMMIIPQVLEVHRRLMEVNNLQL